MKPLTLSVAVAAVVLGGSAITHAQSIEAPVPTIVEAEGLPQLPTYFRDCWEPLPAYCVRPAGLLWFGNTATLARERHAFRPRRVHAVSR